MCHTTPHCATPHHTTPHHTTPHHTTPHHTTPHHTTPNQNILKTHQHKTKQNTTQHNTTQHNTLKNIKIQHNTTLHSRLYYSVPLWAMNIFTMLLNSIMFISIPIYYLPLYTVPYQWQYAPIFDVSLHAIITCFVPILFNDVWLWSMPCFYVLCVRVLDSTKLVRQGLSTNPLSWQGKFDCKTIVLYYADLWRAFRNYFSFENIYHVFRNTTIVKTVRSCIR